MPKHGSQFCVFQRHPNFGKIVSNTASGGSHFPWPYRGTLPKIQYMLANPPASIFTSTDSFPCCAGLDRHELSNKKFPSWQVLRTSRSPFSFSFPSHDLLRGSFLRGSACWASSLLPFLQPQIPGASTSRPNHQLSQANTSLLQSPSQTFFSRTISFCPPWPLGTAFASFHLDRTPSAHRPSVVIRWFVPDLSGLAPTGRWVTTSSFVHSLTLKDREKRTSHDVPDGTRTWGKFHATSYL